MRVRLLLVLFVVALLAGNTVAARDVATFSIVARDPQTQELGVAVASRFFSVGSVVPYAQAGAGAVATQANANVTFGPRGLELLERNAGAKETLDILLRGDSGNGTGGRQLGIVAADGSSATHTGPNCNAWAGGRSGPNYAVQGNIDDHTEPFRELGRLLDYAEMNYTWNRAWTAFTQKQYAEALVAQEHAATLAPENAELIYDLAVIRLVAGKRAEALSALENALTLNPRLKKQAAADKDLDALRNDAAFQAMIKP